MKKFAITYSRISTDESKQDINRQKKPIQDFCKERGFEIINNFWDVISGSSKAATRQGYQKLLKFIEDNKDNYENLQLNVVFDEVTRLGRNQNDILNEAENLTKNGKINLHIASPPITYLLSNGEIDITAKNAFTMFAMFSENELIRIKSRIKSSKYRIIEKAHSFGGVELFGYKNNNKVLEIEKEEAELVKTIFDMYVNKDMGTVAITRYLNTQKLKSRRSNIWRTRTVQKILKNKHYTGVRLLNNIEYPAPELKIIDNDLFEKAQEKFKNKLSYRSNNKKYLHPFSNILKCKCSRSIYVKKQGNALSYICSTSFVDKPEKCNYFTQINYNRMNNIIYTLYDILISETKTNKSYIDSLINEKEQIKRINISVLESELNNYEEKNNKIIDLIIDGMINKEEGKKRQNKLEEEKESKEKELKEYQTRLKEIDSQIEKLNNTDNTSIIDVNQLKAFANNNIKNITIQRTNELNNINKFNNKFRSNETIYKIELTTITDRIFIIYTGNYTPKIYIKYKDFTDPNNNNIETQLLQKEAREARKGNLYYFLGDQKVKQKGNKFIIENSKDIDFIKNDGNIYIIMDIQKYFK